MANMVLVNQKTKKIYGYFGAPYPSMDLALVMANLEPDIECTELLDSEGDSAGCYEDFALVPDSDDLKDYEVCT